jgi:hypothetical protein
VPGTDVLDQTKQAELEQSDVARSGDETKDER